MGFALPNGATVFVGSKMAAATPVSAVSNAKGAVFTVSSGTFAVDDIVLINSGWGLLDNTKLAAVFQRQQKGHAASAGVHPPAHHEIIYLDATIWRERFISRYG